jgi:hypothetical protein
MRSIGPRERSPAKFAAALNYLTKNRWGEVTLAAGASTTEIVDPALNPDTLLFLDPLTASAAAALATTYVAEADRGRGMFVITHSSDAATDRSFRWFAAGD